MNTNFFSTHFFSDVLTSKIDNLVQLFLIRAVSRIMKETAEKRIMFLLENYEKDEKKSKLRVISRFATFDGIRANGLLSRIFKVKERLEELSLQPDELEFCMDRYIESNIKMINFKKDGSEHNYYVFII